MIYVRSPWTSLGNPYIYWIQGSNIVSDLYLNFSTIFITHSNVSEVPSMKKQTSKKKTKKPPQNTSKLGLVQCQPEIAFEYDIIWI